MTHARPQQRDHGAYAPGPRTFPGNAPSKEFRAVSSVAAAQRAIEPTLCLQHVKLSSIDERAVGPCARGLSKAGTPVACAAEPSFHRHRPHDDLQAGQPVAESLRGPDSTPRRGQRTARCEPALHFQPAARDAVWRHGGGLNALQILPEGQFPPAPNRPITRRSCRTTSRQSCASQVSAPCRRAMRGSSAQPSPRCRRAAPAAPR